MLPASRSVFSIATSRLRPPTLLTRMSIGPASASTRLQMVFASLGVGDVGSEGPCLAAAFTYLIGGLCQVPRRLARSRMTSAPASAAARAIIAAEPAAAAGNEETFAVQTEAIKHAHEFLPRRFLPMTILPDKLLRQVVETSPQRRSKQYVPQAGGFCRLRREVRRCSFSQENCVFESGRITNDDNAKNRNTFCGRRARPACRRTHRQARIPHAKPGGRPRPGRRRCRGEDRHRLGFCATTGR